MIKFCGLVAALSLAATTASAATIDVDNLLIPAPLTSGYWSGLGALTSTIPTSPRTVMALQTFTVEKTGALARVDLYGGVSTAYSTDGVWYGQYPGDFDVTLTILGGGSVFTPGDNVLGSVTKSAHDVALFGVTSFDFSGADIRATAGTVLTWQMSVPQCPVAYCNLDWSNWSDFTGAGGGSTNGYAGGAAFIREQGVLYSFGGMDLNFRTWISALEPTTWALMILGFFGAGAALRRSRHRLAGSGM